MPAERRPSMSSRFVLTLGGVQAGFLKSVDGGDITAEVVQEAHDPTSTYFFKKHIASVKYEDFAVEVDFSLADAVYDWIAATWTGRHYRKDGSIIICDSDFNAISEQQFFHASLSEVTIPTCDALAKNPVPMQLKFSPEITRMNKGGGRVSFLDKGKLGQKQWSPSNFRLEIDGLDCTRVVSVGSFTVKQILSTHNVGETRDYEKISKGIEFPNLKITLPEMATQSWQAWFEDFVVRGHNGDAQEKGGALVFLGADRKAELARITFFNLGIFRLGADKAQAGSDQTRTVTAELYCQRMEFKAGGLKI